MVSSNREVGCDASTTDEKGAAARLIQAGGFYMNDERVTDPNTALEEQDLIDGSLVIMRFGKTSHMTFYVEPKP